MSVTTRADEIVDFARKKVQEALEAVNEAHIALNIKPVWGTEEWNADFKTTVAEASTTLTKVKNDLGERRYFD